MADGVFNIAKGKVNAYHDRVNDNDPANSALVAILLKASEADATLEDYATLAAILAEAGNTEADFTNYARIVLTDSDISASVVDDANNRRAADIPDLTWVSAGGASNNTTAKLIICYDPDTTGGGDTALIPLAHYDYVETTTGSNITAIINAGGYFRAA